MKLFKTANKLYRKYGISFGTEPPSFLPPDDEDIDQDEYEMFGNMEESIPKRKSWGEEPPSFLAEKEMDIDWEEEPTIKTEHTDLGPEELDLIRTLLLQEIDDDASAGEDTRHLSMLTDKVEKMMQQFEKKE